MTSTKATPICNSSRSAGSSEPGSQPISTQAPRPQREVSWAVGRSVIRHRRCLCCRSVILSPPGRHSSPALSSPPPSTTRYALHLMFPSCRAKPCEQTLT
jgi:hypothetical protein